MIRTIIVETVLFCNHERKVLHIQNCIEDKMSKILSTDIKILEANELQSFTLLGIPVLKRTEIVFEASLYDY